MHPDFLFFHEVKGELVIDLVDPHQPNAGDTGPKWTGLARYAAEHGDYFRRIVGVIKDEDDHLLSLDLKNPDAGNLMADAANETDIRAIFARFGGYY